jgi:enoyl-CoA hydratase/carnithine racemase
LNSDIILCSPNATFAFPDVKRGTAALMGGLPRFCKTVGLQRAMAISLTGQEIKAEEAKKWGLVWKVIEGGRE